MSGREPKHTGESVVLFGWCSPPWNGEGEPNEHHKGCRVEFECWGRRYVCSCSCHPAQPASNQEINDNEGESSEDRERDQGEPASAEEAQPVTA